MTTLYDQWGLPIEHELERAFRRLVEARHNVSMSLNELPPRIRAKIEVNDNDCWIWQPSPDEKYGRCFLAGKWTTAHAATYQLLVGPVPDGHQLDHTCENKRCANPAHVEPVRPGEHRARTQTRSDAAALAEYKRLGGI